MKIKNLFLAFVFLAIACDKSTTSDPSTPEINTDNPITTTPNTTPDTNTDTGTQNPSVTEAFMDLINQHRQSIGLAALILDQSMTDIVQAHSDGMANGSVAFGHGGFSDRCSAARSALGGGNMCGENVASGQKNAQAVFTSWMNSSGHRANIEQSRYTHCGFAFKKSSSGTIYWTHLFLEKN